MHGQQAGADLVAHPAIRAVGFTGSVNGGRALLEIIERRPDPIPFYGELSSLNPVVITPSAATERGDQIGRELVGSYTLGAGQFCTKPGLTFVPTGADGDRVVDAMAEAIRGSSAQVLLNQGIASSYTRISDELATAPGVQEIARGADSTDAGFRAVPRLLATTGTELPAAVTEECFGPVNVVARYDAEDDLFTALARAALVVDRDRATRRAGNATPAGNLRAAARSRRPAGVRRLPDRCGRLLGPAPRRAMAIDELPAHFRWCQRHPAIPATCYLAGRSAGGAAPGTHR